MVDRVTLCPGPLAPDIESVEGVGARTAGRDDTGSAPVRRFVVAAASAPGLR